MRQALDIRDARTAHEPRALSPREKSSKEKVCGQSPHAATTAMRQALDIRDARTAHEPQVLSPHENLMPASKEKVRGQSPHAVTTAMRQALDIRDARTAHEPQALSPHEKLYARDQITYSGITLTSTSRLCQPWRTARWQGRMQSPC